MRGAVPFEEDSKDPTIWFMDHSYMETMSRMFRKVNGASLCNLAHGTSPSAQLQSSLCSGELVWLLLEPVCTHRANSEQDDAALRACGVCSKRNDCGLVQHRPENSRRGLGHQRPHLQLLR